MATEKKSRSGFMFCKSRELGAEVVVSGPVQDVK